MRDFFGPFNEKISFQPIIIPRSDFSSYLLQEILGSCSDKAAGSGDKKRHGEKLIEVGATG